MFSERLIRDVEKQFEETLPLLGNLARGIMEYMEGCGGEERTLLQYLYGTMPLCDAAEYPPELFASYVKHAIFLKENMAWTKKLPEELFLKDVLYCRINNEDLTDCRGWFYEKLKGLVAGMDEEKAVKEVNYWCAAHVTYAASDDRTLNPVSVYRSGTGRCGEESVFLVTALRSVGIAARQVYTPRWAHCDDNHAWVEAFVHGGWHFLGACEPEEVLDKGWFTNASSRAMLIHAREFGRDEGSGNPVAGEITGRDGAAFFVNDTALYARTSRLTVEVRDSHGRPVEGARVDFELLNMAEYFPVATLYTDTEGRCAVTLGMGSVHVQVSKGEVFSQWMADTSLENEVTLTLNLNQEQLLQKLVQEGTVFLDIKAPADFPMHPARLTKEQKERGRQRKAEADAARAERTRAFYDEASAAGFPGAADLLRDACGNFREIRRFLSVDGEPYREKLLRALAKKDLKDSYADVLEEHLQKTLEMKPYFDKACEGASDDVFVQYVLNPRIGHEMIRSYRPYILDTYSEELQEGWRRSPQRIWDEAVGLLQEAEGKSYDAVVLSPAAALAFGQGSELTKKTLFTAICRTLGIPARINPVDQQAEYYEKGRFVPVRVQPAGAHLPEGPVLQDARKNIPGLAPNAGEEAGCVLTLQCEADERPVYGGNWTIGKLGTRERAGLFQTMDYTGLLWEGGKAVLRLSPGIYRLITTRRLPCGNQLEAEQYIDARRAHELTAKLQFRKATAEEMLEDLELEPFVLTDGQGIEREYGELAGERAAVLCFLEEGMEPTEHVLNEMKDHAKELNQPGLDLFFAVRGKESLANRTLQSVLTAIPRIRVFRADFEELPEQLARRMYTDPDKLPLILLTAPGYRGLYACSGYNVGTVELLLDIVGHWNLS